MRPILQWLNNIKAHRESYTSMRKVQICTNMSFAMNMTLQDIGNLELYHMYVPSTRKHTRGQET